jgi:hypothetical protein
LLQSTGIAEKHFLHEDCGWLFVGQIYWGRPKNGMIFLHVSHTTKNTGVIYMHIYDAHYMKAGLSQEDFFTS